MVKSLDNNGFNEKSYSIYEETLNCIVDIPSIQSKLEQLLKTIESFENSLFSKKKDEYLKNIG
ncbi:hypothetical protein [Methanococcus voltae]|uniref:Uncharacterized protein n=1 Tax=Methanococcus voltae (strain ATCC BAA-1334 / A3) TaxID=456320 RepID=D7DSZ7_METV3|nr:hypothetical protein [Methanococcus voltae]MCS3901967.1 hypothetical protein [Methanococcus voltae]